ncbi:hypothetical protein LZ30DRAFT_199046 [Colletotrichum cereale]|nr:hypothetical protein LZ30DRAFT_199046 [Colletotrichum cereale]
MPTLSDGVKPELSKGVGTWKVTLSLVTGEVSVGVGFVKSSEVKDTGVVDSLASSDTTVVVVTGVISAAGRSRTVQSRTVLSKIELSRMVLPRTVLSTSVIDTGLVVSSRLVASVVNLVVGEAVAVVSGKVLVVGTGVEEVGEVTELEFEPKLRLVPAPEVEEELEVYFEVDWKAEMELELEIEVEVEVGLAGIGILLLRLLVELLVLVGRTDEDNEVGVGVGVSGFVVVSEIVVVFVVRSLSLSQGMLQSLAAVTTAGPD